MKKQKRAIALGMAALLLAGTMTVEPISASAEEQQNAAQIEEDREEQVTQETGISEDNPVSEEEQQEETVDSSEEQTQNDSISDDDNEDLEELKANSWRYRDGEPVSQDNGIASYSSRAASNAWKKVNGRYVNSNGDIIPGAEKKGMDVSEWQGKIDWAKAKADGIEYAVIRCGYGSDKTKYDDKYWKYNVSECERLGIPYGVYLYSYADDLDDAKGEAEHTIRLLKGHHPSLPVYYDLEDKTVESAGKSMISRIAQTYCDELAAAGYRVGIYASRSWWMSYLNTPTFDNSSWSKWVAEWGSKCNYGKSYDMWQCTDTGSVNGVNGNVDLNFWMVKTYDKQPVEVSDSNIISYSSHMQTFGWQDTVPNGYQTGVTGYGKRLEAFKINVGSSYGDLGIRYSAHVQTYGWQDWKSNGQLAGTTGEGKRVEAIKIELTGTHKDNYDVYYRVHAQNYGWLDWAKDGQAAGTQGYGKRIEAIQIALVPSGSTAPGSTEKPFVKEKMSMQYSAYADGIGWRSATEGNMAGTSGQAKMLEGLQVKILNADYDGSIVYNTYMQSSGWTGEKKDGDISGSAGSGKRMEAIKIHLTGEIETYYDVYYRTYCQTYGWLGWAKNDQIAGTIDYSKRTEAVQIRLVSKGGAAPGSTADSYKQALVKYRTHVQTYGWKDYSYDGEENGTTGEAKRMEAIQINLQNPSMNQYIQYKAHVQTYGWQKWVTGGDISGTSGQAKRLEAIQIKLTGEMEDKYDIYYRVHAQTYGWLDWAKNGESAGTEGLSKRLESIQIVLVEKSGAAPGSTSKPFVKKIVEGI